MYTAIRRCEGVLLFAVKSQCRLAGRGEILDLVLEQVASAVKSTGDGRGFEDDDTPDCN